MRDLFGGQWSDFDGQAKSAKNFEHARLPENNKPDL